MPVKTLTQRTRVRMEFTAYPKGRSASLYVDKKFTTLKVMLRERFGQKGEDTLVEWMLSMALEQNDRDGAALVSGGAR